MSSSTEGLSFGHWYPPQASESKAQDVGEWLEVEKAQEKTSHQPDAAGTPLGALAQLFAQMRHQSNPSSSTFISPAVQINLAKRQVRFLHAGFLSRESFSFVFKQLQSPMSLCRDAEEGSFSIVFSLKYPPKTEEEIEMPDGETWSSRRNTWAGVQTETFGTCLGYKIKVAEREILALQQHEKYNELKGFGALDIDDIQSIVSFSIGLSNENRWDEFAESVSNTRIRTFSLNNIDCHPLYDESLCIVFHLPSL